MTRILLARHAASTHHDDEMVQGRMDAGLSDTGTQQATDLGWRLSDRDIDAVYTSPLQRARDTAEHVAKHHTGELLVRDDLTERDFAAVEGDDVEDVTEEADGDLVAFEPPGGGETFSDVQDRVADVLDDIGDAHPDGTVVVVTHGWVTRALLLDAIDGRDARPLAFRQAHTCVNVLDHNSDWELEMLNDTRHLEA